MVALGGAACKNLERMSAEGMQRACWVLRSDRFHPLAACAALKVNSTPSCEPIHGSPPGDESSLAGLFTSRSSHAATLQRRSACSAADLLLAGARAPGTTTPVFPHTDETNVATHLVCSPEQQGILRVHHRSQRIDARSVHLLSNGRYHVVDHQCRWRRVQSLEQHGGHSVARGQYAR